MSEYVQVTQTFEGTIEAKKQLVIPRATCQHIRNEIRERMEGFARSFQHQTHTCTPRNVH